MSDSRILVVLTLALLMGCGDVLIDVLGGNNRSLGTFQACLHRLTDSCATSETSCRSRVSETLTIELMEEADGVLRWSTAGRVVLEGRRVGLRFELSSIAPVPAQVCGCEVLVTETVRGELVPAREVTPVCSFPDEEGTCGPEASVASSRLWPVPLPGDDWLAGGADDSLSATSFGSIHAVVDEQLAFPEAGCACEGCSASFELSGVQ